VAYDARQPLSALKVELTLALDDAGITRAEPMRRLKWNRESVDQHAGQRARAHHLASFHADACAGEIAGVAPLSSYADSLSDQPDASSPGQFSFACTKRNQSVCRSAS